MNGQDDIEQIEDLLNRMKNKTEGININLEILQKNPSILIGKKDDLKRIWDSLKNLNSELENMNDWPNEM